MAKVSVIICVYNRADLIGECINSVLSQDFDDYEIIVVDDGSDDGTPEALNRFRGNEKVRILRNARNLGLMASRNIGAENAASEIVAFIDSDSTVGEGWIKELMEPFGFDRDIVITGGEILDGSASNYWGMAGKGLFRIASESGYVNQIFGGNMVVRKDFLMRHRFDETLKYGADEKDLCVRARREGYRIYFRKTARVVHYQRTAFMDVMKQRFRVGAGNCYCGLKNRLFPFLYVKSIVLLGILFSAFFAPKAWKVPVCVFLGVVFVVLVIAADVMKRAKNAGELALSIPGSVLMAAAESAGDIYGVFNFLRLKRKKQR